MDGSRSDPTVDDFVAVKASKSHKVQRTSTSGPQQVQYQSVKNYKIPQRSIGDRIWFGTRGSEVQILSPRPIFSITSTCGGKPPGFGPGALAGNNAKMLASRELLVALTSTTRHPDEEWMQQMARSVTMEETGFLVGKRYLLHDRASTSCRNEGQYYNLLLFPSPTSPLQRKLGTVRCRERLGGLLKYYGREAA